MILIEYNGVDITDSVSINRCIHDMFAGDQTDTIRLKLNDVSSLWDSWAPSAGDEIRVDYGSISTGTMFLTSATPKNGTYDLTAWAAPKSGFDPQRKAWQAVRLLQVGAEIAARNGLSFSSYGVEDRLYSYILQDGVGDFRFLNRLARREGCAVLIYNKMLVMYSEAYMEALEPQETLNIAIDGDYEYNDRRADLFGSCVVESGQYTGEYTVDNGSGRVYRPTPEEMGSVSSDGEAKRFARNLLRYKNKQCLSGFVRAPVLPGYAAASTVALSNARAPSWDGTVFLNHIRNDYGRGESKIFFRKVLEGY